jgi:hypothetical protein
MHDQHKRQHHYCGNYPICNRSAEALAHATFASVTSSPPSSPKGKDYWYPKIIADALDRIIDLEQIGAAFSSKRLGLLSGCRWLTAAPCWRRPRPASPAIRSWCSGGVRHGAAARAVRPRRAGRCASAAPLSPDWRSAAWVGDAVLHAAACQPRQTESSPADQSVGTCNSIHLRELLRYEPSLFGLKQPRPGVILEQLGIADVTPQGVHRFVPRHVHHLED